MLISPYILKAICDRRDRNSNVKSGVFDYDKLGYYDDNRLTENYGNMASKTGNSYIYLKKYDSIDIPTASLGFLTTASSIKVCRSNFDN